MLSAKTEEGMQWEGIIDFYALDEQAVRSAGLFDDHNALMQAVSEGRFVKRKGQYRNKITNYARQAIVTILTGGIGQIVLPSKMELGSGSGTPSATDVDLWSPSAGTLKTCSNTQIYMTYYVQYICTWLTSDPITGTWTEIGLKDGNGNLWAHALLPSGFTVNNGEMLVGQWQVQIIGN